jgi:hypothetical protein
MGEVTIEATVLTVTPVNTPQGQTMIQMTIGDTIKPPVTMPLEVDRELAGVTIAIQKTLSQLPGISQSIGAPRLTLVLSEQEYNDLGRPRYPDRVTVNIKV